jgi:hypothetical protein
MIAAALAFLSFVTGIAATLLFAIWYSTRPKKEAQPKHNGFSATSVSLNGNSGTEMDAVNARLLNQVLKGISDHKLFELPGQHTRHWTMRESDFREDRDWNCDLPDIEDVLTLADKVRYQQILRRKWDALPNRLPSDIMELPFPDIDAPWWQHPYRLSPERERQLIERQRKRYERRRWDDADDFTLQNGRAVFMPHILTNWLNAIAISVKPKKRKPRKKLTGVIAQSGTLKLPGR